MATTTKSTPIFVSHISEESEVAGLLKEMLEGDFLNLVTLFASSDLESIQAGDDWLESIHTAMHKAAIVLVLCSKASVQRPWVQFEVGAAWMKGMRIVPVCHSGLTVEDLRIPLESRFAIELGSGDGLTRLYKMVASSLGLKRIPTIKDLPTSLQRINEVEARFRRSGVRQFENYIDVILAPPGRLQSEVVPNSARVVSDPDTLAIFGLQPGSDYEWKDIVGSATRVPDTRWLSQLQRTIYLASNDQVFRPIQAVFHAEERSYQPQLARKEVLPHGEVRFHVHLVDTVVAPLSEVDNDFGLLATLLRLGLRFRYEVIERFRRLGNAGAGIGANASLDDSVRKLRDAIETIENDAMSRGAQNIDRESVIELFEAIEDQTEMVRVQQDWDQARVELFRTDPAPTVLELAAIMKSMRDLNVRFMKLGTRRFHEMVAAQWS